MSEEAIADYDSYIKGMQKSLDDKLFFEKWLDGIEVFVDFGCADGALLQEMYKRHPRIKLAGIDMNEIMLKKLRFNCVKIHSDLPEKPCLIDRKAAALNLSSVLHEVYSYGSAHYIKAFWDTVNREEYEYVFIRDMLYENSRGTIPDAWHTKIFRYGNREQIADFERYHGSLVNSRKNMVHFLLKYRYTSNWDREVRENYLSFNFEDVADALAPKYDCVHMERYSMPFLRDKIKHDFDIDFNEMTHTKMVFKLRN